MTHAALLDSNDPHQFKEQLCHSYSTKNQRTYSPWPDNKWDFVLPNDLSAGILVQFALQPELKSIYTELLSPEGKELFFRPAYLYSSHSDKRGVTFEQLSVGARERGEVAVGVHLAGEQRPMINPPRDLRLKLNDGDKLVVIGDEF